MEDSINKILEQTRFTFTSDDGTEFVLRKLTAQIAIEAIGPKAFGLIKGQEMADKAVEDPDPAENMGLIERYLKVAMVSPRLGTITKPEDNVISFMDLGKYAVPVFNAFIASGEGEGANFTRS